MADEERKDTKNAIEKIDILIEQLQRLKNISQQTDISSINTTPLDETTELLKSLEMKFKNEATQEATQGYNNKLPDDKINDIRFNAFEAMKEYESIIDVEGEDIFDFISIENQLDVESEEEDDIEKEDSLWVNDNSISNKVKIVDEKLKLLESDEEEVIKKEEDSIWINSNIISNKVKFVGEKLKLLGRQQKIDKTDEQFDIELLNKKEKNNSNAIKLDTVSEAKASTSNFDNTTLLANQNNSEEQMLVLDDDFDETLLQPNEINPNLKTIAIKDDDNSSKNIFVVVDNHEEKNNLSSDLLQNPSSVSKEFDYYFIMVEDDKEKIPNNNGNLTEYSTNDRTLHIADGEEAKSLLNVNSIQDTNQLNTLIIDGEVVELRNKTPQSSPITSTNRDKDFNIQIEDVDENVVTILKPKLAQSYEINRPYFSFQSFSTESEEDGRGEPDGKEKDAESPRIDKQKYFKRKQFIIEELIDTEESYINSLKYVIKEYIEYVVLSGITKNSKDQFNAMLGLLASISTNSEYFLSDLRLHQNDCNKLASTFLKHKSLFERYPLYCKNKCVSTEILTGNLKNLIEKKERNLEDKLGLNSRLLQPIQRLAKYELLLIQLKQCQEYEKLPISDIEDALIFIKNIAQTSESLILLESIRGKSFDSDETGEFIKRGIFNTSKKPTVVFVFKNMIVLTEEDPKLKEFFNYKDHILKADIAHIECNNINLRFRIHCKTDSKATFMYELDAVDRKSAMEWVRVLSEVNKLNDTRKPRNRKVHKKKL